MKVILLPLTRGEVCFVNLESRYFDLLFDLEQNHRCPMPLEGLADGPLPRVSPMWPLHKRFSLSEETMHSGCLEGRIYLKCRTLGLYC